MPSRKEIQWSELRVGVLIMAAIAVLIGTILLMSGSTGGLFARKLILRAYIQNASGLKDGAPVTLEGVTIGNVTHVRVVPDRNPTPVEVTMQLGREYMPGLHTDSTISIAQAGVLGDSYIDISSSHASGPPPPDHSELRATNSPSIQDVIRSSQDSITEVQTLITKIAVLVDTLNSKKGSAGELINDPALYTKLTRVANNLETITGNVASGKGSLGKLMNDDSLYTRANSAVDKLDKITTGLNDGRGTAGKLLTDDSLYKNLNAAVGNANQLLADVNAGKGPLGKLAKDPEFARKLDDTLTNLDTLLQGVNAGKGTLGQLATNRSLYDHTDQTMDQAQQLVKGIREDPKKYLVIHMRVF